LPNVPVRFLSTFCSFSVPQLSFPGLARLSEPPGHCPTSVVPIIKPPLKTTQHSKGFDPGPDTLLLSLSGAVPLISISQLPNFLLNRHRLQFRSYDILAPHNLDISLLVANSRCLKTNWRIADKRGGVRGYATTEQRTSAFEPQS
jgi:hypothetical protein